MKKPSGFCKPILSLSFCCQCFIRFDTCSLLDPLHGARGTSFSGAHPGLYTDAVSTERPTYSSTLFLERGAVKQTLYTQVSANAVATDQIDLQVGSSDVASNHSESSGSVCVPGFPENNHQATVSDANTVHVVFSRVLATMNPHSSSVQAYPGVATQFIPNSPISPVPLANTAVPSLQQCHFPPSPATAADKAHPLIPSNFVNVPLQHPHAAAVPVYPPASFPLSLHQPVAVDVATGLPVYPIGQPFILPGDANSRQAVTSSFMPSSIGGPFIGCPAANSVPSSSASLLHQVQQSAETLRASEDSSILAAMSAGLLQPPESVSVNAAQEIDAACHQFGTVLEEVTKRNHLHGDYRFLVDYYRSVLEGGPTDAIRRVTGVQTLKHFLKMAQGKLWAESYELRKSCLSLQSLTDKCQERIRQDGDRYKKVLNKKRNAEKNVGLVAKRLKEQKKRKLMGMGPDEVKELEAKLETLRNERDELQKKWLNHEQTRIQAPSEEEHP